jgi:hypothetical protein
MSFRIRRGTEAQRAAAPAFDLGEPVWTTDKQKLYIGDGVTQGGIPLIRLGTGLAWADVNGIPYITATGGGGGGGGGGITAIVQDVTPNLGGNLTLNSFNIQGTGNISITGSLSTTGTANLAGGLGGNLSLNSYNIVGTGNIAINGTASFSTGLGGTLRLNSHDIIGTGNININGSIDSVGQTNMVGVANVIGSEASVTIKNSRSGTTVLQNTDLIGAVKFAGWSGSAYTTAGVLFTQMASNVSSNLFAADTGIYTLNADGNFRPFWFRNTGLFEVTGISLVNLTTTQINSFASIAPEGTVAYDTTKNRLIVSTGSVAESVATSVTAPSTATSAGVPGQFASDSSYIYVCTALNTWKRASIAAW